MSSVKLHTNYGLNPTIPQCFWCGKDRNEVALLGASYKGEAPMHMIIDYEPCDTCREMMSSGIAFIEATEALGAEDRKKSLHGFLPTGRWVVVRREAVEKWDLNPQIKDHVLKAGRGIMEPETFNTIFGDA